MEGQRAGERTRLLRAPGSKLGARTRRLYGDPDEDDEDEEELRDRESRRREKELRFGNWPWKLFNAYVRPSLPHRISILLPTIHSPYNAHRRARRLSPV